MLNSHPDFIYTTLVHELQHMIHFSEKFVRHGVNSQTWYHEMLSMMAEDIISPLMGVGPTNSEHPIRLRIPNFLTFYFNRSLTSWDGDYAGKYAFGAYLLRNYDGAQLLKEILANDSANTDSITAALYTVSGGSTFESALIRYAEALLYSGQQMPHDVKTFDRTVTSTINGTTYTAQGFDVWKDFTQKGPVIFDLGQRYMAYHSVSVHSANSWKNVSGDFYVTLERPNNEDIVLILMVK
jgi:hypothetical protein